MKDIDWTDDDIYQSQKEGWGIWWNLPTDKPEIQRFVESEENKTFEEDWEAWEHVFNNMIEGSELHTKALNIIKEYNITEYLCIIYNSIRGHFPRCVVDEREGEY